MTDRVRQKERVAERGGTERLAARERERERERERNRWSDIKSNTYTQGERHTARGSGREIESDRKRELQGGGYRDTGRESDTNSDTHTQRDRER